MADICLCTQCNIILFDIHIVAMGYMYRVKEGYRYLKGDRRGTSYPPTKTLSWFSNIRCTNCEGAMQDIGHTNIRCTIKLIKISDSVFLKLWQFHNDLKDQPFKHYGVPLNNPETNRLFKEFMVEELI
jgi:hypothetical protein